MASPSTASVARNKWRKHLLRAGQLTHAMIVVAGVVGMVVEFSQPPPFFDSFFVHRTGLPDVSHVFHAINPVMRDQSAQFHQLMDMPILLVAILYLGATFYLRFNLASLTLTAVAFLNYAVYVVVNTEATKFFEWRYFYSRGVGIALQLLAISLLGATSVTMVLNRRNRMMFHMKSPFNIKVGGLAHILWNLIGQSLLYYACLTIWISRSYQTYVCTQDVTNLNFLCQMTEQVACIPCNVCTDSAFDECASNTSRLDHPTAYCISGIPYDKGFCIINYSTGYLTFVKLFAYVGGLFFFLRAFLNAACHYCLIIVHSAREWWRGNNPAEKLEATLSSLSTRLSLNEPRNLRQYFRSRGRRESAPGGLVPSSKLGSSKSAPSRPAATYKPPAHSPIHEGNEGLERHGRLVGSVNADAEDSATASESTPLVASSRSSTRRGYGANLRSIDVTTVTGTAAAGPTGAYTLPSPQVQPVGVAPGQSVEIDPLA